MSETETELVKALNDIRDIIRFHGDHRLPKGASRQIDTIAQIALRPYRKADAR